MNRTNGRQDQQNDTDWGAELHKAESKYIAEMAIASMVGV